MRTDADRLSASFAMRSFEGVGVWGCSVGYIYLGMVGRYSTYAIHMHVQVSVQLSQSFVALPAS